MIDLPAFLRGLDDTATLPERSLLLTFDDGYLSMRTVALAGLLWFGYPAVLFAPTDFVGCRNDFDVNEPDQRLCGWDDLRELDSEIRRSKHVLEDELGEPVARRCERAGYRAACLYKGGRFRLPATDRFRLRRVAMGPDTDVARALGRS